MKISSRTKKIIKILINNVDYIVTEQIAEKLDVSSRTILRELKKVEKWLQKNNILLEKKKGTGIRLDCSPAEKRRIKEILEFENVDQHYSPAERKMIILAELLKDQRPNKLYAFTRVCNVSEATISNDLDEIENWLKEYQLRLIRKPGLGVYINGRERDIRKASINLLYQNFDLEEILLLLQDKYSEKEQSLRKTLSKNRLLNLIGLDTINLLDNYIKELEEKMNYRLADDSYAALMVHLAIALKRIKDGDQIIIDQKLLEKIKTNDEFLIARNLVTSIADAFNVEIPEAEVAYVTMHLMGSKGRGGIYNDEISMTEDYHLVHITRKMIETAEIELGIYLEDDEELLIGLVRHLEPTINRIKLNLDIRNPLLEEIKKKYAKLFQVSKKCAEILAEKEKIKVPESEAAYIAMHLGSAVERKRKPQQKYRAAVACTSGIGASRLLASRLSKEFENIEITSLISTLDFDNQEIENMNLDLIISTVAIPESKVPVIVVNPLLNEKQQQAINDFLLSHQAKKQNNNKQITLKEKLEMINNYNQGILEVLNNFQLQNNYDYQNIEKLIKDAAQMLTPLEEKRKGIEADLSLREEKGSTVLKHNQIMLLHCQSSAVKELYFAVIRPESTFKIQTEADKKTEIKIVILMAAPLKGSIQGREVLSEISHLLIENQDFIEAVKSGSKEDIYYGLAEHFDYFLQQKSMVNYHKEEN
ncbi:BglG family transcription antiterminator [Halanaerobium congolense]|jgi:mannitol operon transcriptional antiterminator|uniref:BglG family transcriptional antiterminator n=1 Tax=Halanaerobium congolense TaxID=54121 RepID=A0A1G6N0E4_9FIRM|nr:PRD domain-containing protein [Halanaerobium congolense]KXS50230.1 MAG: mannitol operon transcriptional antiterminator [Halanaerobium sp. T82-1]OEG63431.1 MAG: transcriptional antiterminator BglG [Halanaerobium sp. MDAL1]PUU89504.1 MAG: mannitol operon transcriptional antiterminator [Halanaerobium sp.]PXV67619.1 BglG family transcriptional antiterminator [Halanaerobium congolense]TDP26689.1 BglG family transcriptional antiterminator [Halanaerobium congolense]